MKPQIFLSYARPDQEKVEDLYRKLSDAGFQPWMDTQDLLPGEFWEHAIQEAIRRADFFLACLSANSVNRRGFLQEEIKAALDNWRKKLVSDIYLIPVRLEDCEVPESLRLFQWVDLFVENGWPRLVKAIQAGMERRGEAVQSVEPQPTEPVRPSPPQPSPPPSPSQPPAPFVNPTDGSELVLIPGGDFTMGEGDKAHPVHVDSFYLGKYQVTNAQWKKFVDAKPEWGKDRIKKKYHSGHYLDRWNGDTPPAGKDNHPVVYVSWYAAVVYCEWAGLRLPTEAEWEYAAQGGQGYEYGTATGELSPELANYGGNEGGTTPVGKYPPNPFGIHDLSGNVWEWCSSEYRPYPYRAGDGREEIQTNIDKDMNMRRVVRGGSWFFILVFLTRARDRNFLAPALTFTNYGLRCARAPRP